MQEFSPHAPILQDQSAHAHGKLESSRPRAAGIEIEHSVARLLLGNMAVAADYNRESSGLRLEVQLCQIVQYIDGNATQFKHLGSRQLARPRTLVDVAAHRSHGSNRGKFLEDLGRADIPGMNDVFGPV